MSEPQQRWRFDGEGSIWERGNRVLEAETSEASEIARVTRDKPSCCAAYPMPAAVGGSESEELV